MVVEPDPQFCRVEQALGRAEICLKARCPFWNSGDEERQAHCALDRVDFRGRRAFAEWLHGLRAELGEDQRNPIRHEFFRRMNEGRGD